MKEKFHLTLSVKMLTSFALIYYGLYFLLISVFGFSNGELLLENSDPEAVRYFDNYLLLVILWFVLLAIMVSLVFVIIKKRYGKFAFMIFSIILIIYQFCTTDHPVWLAYFLEALMVAIIGPVKFLKENKILNNKILKVKE